jgi:hypothetical protein
MRFRRSSGTSPGHELSSLVRRRALRDSAGGYLQIDYNQETFNAEFTSDLSESPKGTLTLNKARVRPGEAVDFTVELTPSTLDYFLLGYNVTGVELYRKREDESEFPDSSWKAMDQIASNRATYRWVPEEADAGKYQFAAFVNTLVLTPLLEVAPSSIQPLEVACFSAVRSAG